MFWASVAEAASTFMPPQGSKIAAQVDSLYGFLVWASLISCVLVIVGFIYFSIKYKRKTDNDKVPYISHNSTLEFLWSFIPFVIFMAVFAWGTYVYVELRRMPKDGLEVLVEGQKWNWTFYYKSGKVSAAELVVPVNTPIKLVLTSKDVLHSFFLPAFRNKQDAVPGTYKEMWVNAEKIGTYQVFCAEYCGDNHSGMLAKMVVKSREDFDHWLETDTYKGMSMLQIGETVYKSRCVACHTLSDQPASGPGWKGLYGKTESMEGGGTAVIDDNYIRESLLQPQAKIVKGFKTVNMPVFAGQLSEQEIMGVIDFIKSLK